MYQQLKTKETYPPLSLILAETLKPGLIYQTTSTPIGTNTKEVLLSAVNRLEQVNFTCFSGHANRDDETIDSEDKTYVTLGSGSSWSRIRPPFHLLRSRSRWYQPFHLCLLSNLKLSLYVTMKEKWMEGRRSNSDIAWPKGNLVISHFKLSSRRCLGDV